MIRYISLITILFYFLPACCKAQAGDISGKDSISVSDGLLFQVDTVFTDSMANKKLPVRSEKFKPNSKKATLYAALFPGLGQIYNRKYWKLPLVYGGFIGCIYAISWNGNQYNGYRKAYIDFIDEDPTSNSWEDYRYGAYRRMNFEDWTEDMKRNFADALKSARDFNRRNRDLSYIITVGVYAISIIDAYVDAQLFDFDISPDLSMHVEPVFLDRTPINSRSWGMQLSFTFK